MPNGIRYLWKGTSDSTVLLGAVWIPLNTSIKHAECSIWVS